MTGLFTPLSTFSGGGRLIHCRILHFVFVGLFALSFVLMGPLSGSVLAAPSHSALPPLAVVHVTNGYSVGTLNDSVLTGSPNLPTNRQVTSFKLDGVTVKVRSPFLPHTTFVTSKAGDTIQGAISVSDHPYREFSVVAVPFGTHPGSEAVPVAQAGGAAAYRLALHVFRLKQGGHPQAGPTATLFGQQVIGEVSLSKLHLDSSTLKPTLIVEWVVEAGHRLWIVRIVQEQTREGMAHLQTLSAITLSSTTLDTPSTLPNAIQQYVRTPDAGQKPHRPHPFDLSNPSWWNGTCDSNNNGGSYPLGANFQGMLACGPLGGNYVVHFFPGAWGVLEWQCVELSMRYLYLAYGVNPYPANGSQVVWNYSGSALQKIGNGTPNAAPQAGDVLSYGSTQSDGHTSVVSASNVDGNGNGSITVIEENASYNGSDSIAVSNWTVQPTYGMNISGWLHNPLSPPPNRLPIGNVDSVNVVTATGWAFDPDVSSTSIDTQMNIDGNLYDMGPTPVYRSDVNANYGISGNHGFAWAIPLQWRDGRSHSWQIYAVDPDYGNTQTLIGSGTFHPLELHVVYRGTQNDLRQTWWDGTKWQTQQLPSQGQVASDPSTSTYNGEQHVVYRNTQNQLWQAWWDGTKWQSQQLPSQGQVAGNPMVATYNDGQHNEEHVVYRNTQNQLWQAWWDGTKWQTQQLASNIVGDPNITQYNHEEHVVYRDAHHQLWQTYWNWQQWTTQLLATQAASDPKGMWYNDGQHDENHVVYRNTKNELWQAWYDGTKWQSQLLASNIVGDPNMTQYGSEEHVVYRDAHHQLWQMFWNWQQWTTQLLATQVASDAAQTQYMNGQQNEHHVMYRDMQNELWQAWYDGTKWQSQPLANQMAGNPAVATY